MKKRSTPVKNRSRASCMLPFGVLFCVHQRVFCACLMQLRQHSSLHAAGGQTLHKEPLAEDEDHNHRNQRQHGHGKHISPLRELMLAEEAGDGDGQCAQAVVVDDGVGPRIFLPRGQKVEDADGGNRGRGQRQRNPAIRLEYVGAVDPCGVMISPGMFSINPLIMKVEKGITHAT